MPTHALPPKWERRLNDPRYYFNFVDVCRRLVKPTNEINAEALGRALREEMGSLVYNEMLDACMGKLRFLALAEKFTKIRWVRHQVIALDDPNTRPFWEEEINEASFARARY